MKAGDGEPHPAESTDAASDRSGARVAPTVVRPTRMERREQYVGWAVAGIVAAAIAVSWAGGAVRGDSTALVAVAIGVVMVALLAIAVWHGQRVITSFTAITAGFVRVKPDFVYLSFASLAYGVYLMFRTSRAQTKLAASRPRRQPRPSRRARAEAAAAETKAKAAGPAGVPGGRRPSANRRYTPPKSKGTTKRR